MEADPPIFGDDDYDPEDEDIIETPEDESAFLKDYETKKKQYKTTPVLTKYERARVIGERANQIINGSKSMLSDPGKNAYEIAIAELQQNKIPFIVKRPYGNSFEYWKLEDLM
jgi:DNA-directed RNA polymerase subunit K/omega